MKLTVLYDNEIFKKELGLKSDWGFSCLIQNNDETILFDTGAKGEILLDNMKKLGINPNDINKIIISHEHWDHNGGLKTLVSLKNNVEIYRFEKRFFNKNIKTIIVKEPMKISDDIYTTGRLKGSPVDEQSLVLKTNKGNYILTGCSHPGVIEIIKNAKKIDNIVGIIGGFHGFKELQIFEELDYICPCHCTKYKNKILRIYPDKTSRCGVGKVIDLEI